jgi:hypothetical protein
MATTESVKIGNVHTILAFVLRKFATCAFLPQIWNSAIKDQKAKNRRNSERKSAGDRILIHEVMNVNALMHSLPSDQPGMVVIYFGPFYPRGVTMKRDDVQPDIRKMIRGIDAEMSSQAPKTSYFGKLIEQELDFRTKVVGSN